MMSVLDLYRQAEDLKHQLSFPDNDKSNYELLYELRSIFVDILRRDLDQALDNKIEQELWNVCFKNQITTYQTDTKDQEGPANEKQVALNWFLESSIGFFFGLLEEFTLSKNQKSLGDSDWASYQYFLQYCLLHLGDLMRYKNASLEAETYYRHALRLCPSNGQPYNQLALLEAARGDKLSAIYYYIRSLAVRHPFPPASANLQKLYSKYISSSVDLSQKSRLSAADFVLLFLKLQGHLYLVRDLDRADQLVHSLYVALCPLLAAEKISSSQLLKIVSITLYTADQGLKEAGEKTESDEKRQSLLLDTLSSLLHGFVSSPYLLPTTKLKFAPLPAIKLLLDWLFLHSDLLFRPSFATRGQLWTAFAKFLNELQALNEANTDFEDEETQPLDEDLEFREFSPLRALTAKLEKIQKSYFKAQADIIRVRTVLKRAQWIASQEKNGTVLLSCKTSNGKFEFEAPSICDISQEMASVDISNIKKGILKVRNETEREAANRKPRNVALISIMRRAEEVKKDIVTPPEPLESADSNRQVSFQVSQPSTEVQSPSEPLNSRSSGYQRSVLPPRLERLRAEQREKDNILANLGLFSGFGTSVCSVPPPAPPLVDITKPPPLLQPPPGLWDPRVPVPSSSTWSTGFPAIGTSTAPSFSPFSLFNSTNPLRGLTPGLSSEQSAYFPTQSLWKDTGLSPLEKLLEQQKASRQSHSTSEK